MQKTRWLALLVVMLLVVAACGDGAEETTTTAGDGGEGGVDMSTADFTVFGAPTGVEGEAMTGFMNVYNAEVGSNIQYVGSDDYENQIQIRVDGGDPPAVSFTPQPASICGFADKGALVSLEDMGYDIAEMEANHSKFWMDLGLCADGKHYGIPWFPNYKSIIWYHEPTFQANGYEIPETWDDLMALSDQILADEYAPWCFGFESDTATGWPGTDWIEDILVRQSGGDVYGQWFRHEIPFTDPAVKGAFDTFGELFFADGYVLGGPENAASINFRDAPLPMFDDPPKCLMHKQGSFVTNFFPEGGEDIVKFFPFPTIDGNAGAMGGGDTLMVFDDSPEVVQAVKDWITPDWLCTLASPGGGGVAKYGGHGVAGVERLPGHKDVNLACYETETSKLIAPSITEALAANTFVFDASDLMDPAVGQGTFWSGMVNWSKGTSTDQVLQEIEAGWP